MILFADTSALIKLYIDEPGSTVMQDALTSHTIAVSPLIYGETFATFARRRRESLLDAIEHVAACDAFRADWSEMVLVPFTDRVLTHIPTVCNEHPLRGADAMQLACALMLRAQGLDTTFATADRRLADAGASCGLPMLEPGA